MHNRSEKVSYFIKHRIHLHRVQVMVTTTVIFAHNDIYAPNLLTIALS